MRCFALTYPQLVRQALAAQLDDDAVRKLRDTFSVAQGYFDGLYRASGEPLICHTVRTASILLAEGQPLTVVAAALVHAVYTIFRYDDSTRRRPVARLRERVRRDVGVDVEAILWGFHESRWPRRGAPELLLRALPGAAPELRSALALHVANDLENHLELARQYETGRHPKERIESDGPAILELARALGMPTLADELSAVFHETLEQAIPGSAGRRPREYELPLRTTSRVSRATRFADRVSMALRRRLGRGRSARGPRADHSVPEPAVPVPQPPASTSRSRPRILITGAGGRVGREIVPLLREHFSLRLLDVEPVTCAAGDDEIVRADVRNAAALRRACRDVSAIVHLAGAPSKEPRFTTRMMPANIDGTYQVFEAARASGVSRVVLASSGQVVGGYPISDWVAADAPVRPSSVYACTKVFGEALARYYAECHGIDAICLRIGWLDTEDGDLVRSRPEMRRMWCSTRDFAQLVVRSVQSDVRFAVLFAVSDNPLGHWDLDVAREVLGYVPESRAPRELATVDERARE